MLLKRFLTKTGLLAIALVLLVGCVTTLHRPTPEDYNGPIAWIEDTTYQESSGKGRIFGLVAIDDNKIKSSFIMTQRASQGSGFALSMESTIHRVVAGKKQKLSLEAGHVTAAPIHALMTTMLNVKKDVEFTPEPNKTYVIKGQLKPQGSSVWIEDKATGQRVTE